MTEVEPRRPDQEVRRKEDPGRRGKTTGNVKNLGPLILVEVAFGPNEKDYVPLGSLEIVPEQEDATSLLTQGAFGGPKDLRRILTFRKVKGDLTNVFYSMESSNTDFYPHQFKPVLSFIESVSGRLLIADEVGLGKTIESMYIWKELQAREDARRLLIVSPAMLREKWKLDLRNRFNIDAIIVNAASLLEDLDRVVNGEEQHRFVGIVSLEGIRPPRDWHDAARLSNRARLARVLDENPASAARAPLFDLVIVDEAHYLRNPETLSNRMGRLLRESSRNLLLLTATPIQTHAGNLYNLLRLLDPDFFTNEESFNSLLKTNGHIVTALRRLWSSPLNIEDVISSLRGALRTPEFSGDEALTRACEILSGKSSLSTEERVDIGRMVETRSLLSHYMSRTRKRDAFENRTIRDPHVVEFEYTEAEAHIYSRVSKRIREMSRGSDEIGVFRLIARQRQMASSMVAAIQGWDEQGILEEYLWEDFGRYYDGDGDTGLPADSSHDTGIADAIAGYDLRQLEQLDGKYRALRDLIQGRLSPNRKVVVFAFFRNTLRYLNDRLNRDGIRCSLIVGGMGEEKYRQIDQFRDDPSTQVLLSSEVGSEGIDLQFCSVLVNYDLPWNPMRVEQRIGRIDRLGQSEAKIHIYNFYNTGTIEDRVLRRLYERLDLFRNSIGDLEEILGDIESELFAILLEPDLTEEERTKRAEQTAMAIRNRNYEQSRLEEEAVNLVGFTDYLMDSIKQTRDHGRWIDPEDLRSFVSDFIKSRYPGSIIKSDRDGSVFHLQLSGEARDSLDALLRRTRFAVGTGLHRSRVAVPVVFDPRLRNSAPRGAEIVTVHHPLIRWITELYETEGAAFHPVVAVSLPWSSELGIDPGTYVFSCERWEITGLRTRVVLAYQAITRDTGIPLSPSDSERLVVASARSGTVVPNARNAIDSLAHLERQVGMCEAALTERLSRIYENARAENEAVCRQVDFSARQYAERRINQHRELIEQFRSAGRAHLIPMREGLIRSEEHARAEKLSRIEKQRLVGVEASELARGYLQVVEGA